MSIQLAQHAVLEGPGDRTPPRSGLPLRLRVFFLRRRLDAQLAHGADPGSSRELELRARRLQSDAVRHAIARGLEGVVELAEEPPSLYVDVPLRHDAICREAGALLSLSARLRAPGPVNPRGVALALRLLDDQSGPLYRGEVPGGITRAAFRAADLLG